MREETSTGRKGTPPGEETPGVDAKKTPPEPTEEKSAIVDPGGGTPPLENPPALSGGSGPTGTVEKTGDGDPGNRTAGPGNGGSPGGTPPGEEKREKKRGSGEEKPRSKLRDFSRRRDASSPDPAPGTFNNIINNIFGGGENGGAARSLHELTSELPARDPAAARLPPGESEPRHRRLMAERLLLISCVDPEMQRAAVYAVVEGLGAEPGQARVLNFHQLSGDDAPQTIYTLVQAPAAERVSDVVVVVDAVSPRAQPFLDHLLDPRAGLLSASLLQGQLRDAKLLLVCLAPRERFAGPRVEVPFSHWAVPFLQPLLAAAFPGEEQALCESILRQQAAGRWSRGEEAFCAEVRAALAAGTLKEMVAAGGPVRGGEVALDEDQPVHNAVLYTGAYFSRLNPADFGRVVTVLLGDETAQLPAPPPAAAPATEGAPRPAPRKEKKLAEVWRESGDRILRECRMAVFRDPEGGRTVGFADPGAGDALRERLEDEYAFSLHGRFAALHRAGLLFDRSDAVAGNVVRLTASMAAEYPESYGPEWVLERLDAAREAEPDGEARVLKRFAELLRGLCEHARLQPAVASVMEQLLAGREFGVALALVRRLRFAPGFDEFHWMRQLIDRGGHAIAEATSQFLYNQLLNAGLQVYPLLHALRPWVPAEDRPAAQYSPSNRTALQLLTTYAGETAERVKPEDYGAWPSRYPLLALPTVEAAERDLSLVLGWLLHPGVPAAFAGEMEDLTAEALEVSETEAEEIRTLVIQHLVAALLAEWVFILYGASGTPADPSAAEGAAVVLVDGLGPDALLDVLAGQLVARTADRRGRQVRQAMLHYWEYFKEELARVIADRDETTPAQRTEAVWQRRLLRVLPLRIRSRSGAAAAAATPAAV